jgi:hypothetical protein
MSGSIYCLPADVLDEGATAVVDAIALRTGLSTAIVAANYHTSRDVYPHDAVRRTARIEAGAFYDADGDRYPDATLRPVRSADAGGRDLLGEVCSAAAAREMEAAAWAVFLHRDELAHAGEALQASCFGDTAPSLLCPANPAVRRAALTMVAELCEYPITALHAESLHYHGLAHGDHHERILESYGRLALFVLGLCFCGCCLAAAAGEGGDGARLQDSCRRFLLRVFETGGGGDVVDGVRLSEACGEEIGPYLTARAAVVATLAGEAAAVARRAGVSFNFIDQTIPMQSYASGAGYDAGDESFSWQLGVDAARISAAGVVVEVPVYLADPAAAATAIGSYRAQVPEPGALAVTLRPGPPDTGTAGELRANVEAAHGAGCRDISFYAYGLYRLGSLDLVREAVA